MNVKKSNFPIVNDSIRPKYFLKLLIKNIISDYYKSTSPTSNILAIERVKTYNEIL